MHTSMHVHTLLLHVCQQLPGNAQSLLGWCFSLTVNECIPLGILKILILSRTHLALPNVYPYMHKTTV